MDAVPHIVVTPPGSRSRELHRRASRYMKGHILRMSPPFIMPEEVAAKGLEILEEAIDETERELL